MFHANVTAVDAIADKIGLAEVRVTDVYHDRFRKHVRILWGAKKLNVVLFLQFARVDVHGDDQHARVVHECDFVDEDRRLDTFSGDSSTDLDELAVFRFKTERTVFGVN